MSAAASWLTEGWKRFGSSGSNAVRFCDGPVSGLRWSADFLGGWVWLTQWQTARTHELGDSDFKAWSDAVKQALPRAQGAVLQSRPFKGAPPHPTVLFGTEPASGVEVSENLGNAQLRAIVRFGAVSHPGIFLDHAPLRRWIFEHSRGERVMNTFAYTGLLGVAAGLGGATEVVNADLSKKTLLWADENTALNGVSGVVHSFAGDTMRDLKIRSKKGERFGGVILDPPSFSRSKTSVFSTDKDLGVLHELALSCVRDGGWLSTSINSVSIGHRQFESHRVGVRLEHLLDIESPEPFPRNQVKGWVFRVKR